MSKEEPATHVGQPDVKTTYGLAKDSITTVITLSSGILGISLTFSKNWAEDAASDDRAWLITAWVLFLISVVFGIASLLILAGLSYEGHSISRRFLRVPWMVQLITFVLALICFFVFGVQVIDDLADPAGQLPSE